MQFLTSQTAKKVMKNTNTSRGKFKNRRKNLRKFKKLNKKPIGWHPQYLKYVESVKKEEENENKSAFEE